MLNKLNLVMVVVSEMERSTAFYRDTLGIPLRFTSPGWTEFDLDGVTLALHIAGEHLSVPAGLDGRANPGISLGFYVPDLDATLGEITGRGGSVSHRTEEEFGSLAIVPDPDGYLVQICQIKPHS